LAPRRIQIVLVREVATSWRRPTVPPEIRRVIREMSIMFSVLTPTKTIGPQIQSQNRDEMNAGFRKAAYTAIGQ
jgi:hypothetical protein